MAKESIQKVSVQTLPTQNAPLSLDSFSQCSQHLSLAPLLYANLINNQIDSNKAVITKSLKETTIIGQ